MKSSGPDRPTFVARRSLPSERLGARRPQFTRQLAEMVAGLQMDPTARKLGGDDADAGIFRLSVEDILGGGGDIDALAYLRGWLERNERKQSDKRRES
jgi:hypothetical protein